jgi:hypothetical protein
LVQFGIPHCTPGSLWINQGYDSFSIVELNSQARGREDGQGIVG